MPVPMKDLGPYRLVSRPIVAGDVAALHALSIGVRWPHRAEDWAMLAGLGSGVIAEDEIGRTIGCAMCFPMAPDLVQIGMVITTPRLQEQGAGAWMMAQLAEAVAGRDQLLTATRASVRLYLALGFRPGATVWQHQGTVVAVPTAVGAARPMTGADADAVRALDAAAYTAERRAAMDALLAVSTGSIVERGGRIAGFALCRPFGRGYVVGPVVAETEADAMALVSPHIAAHAGRFLRLDTRETEGPLRDYLAASGMPLYDTATAMAKGRERTPAGAARTLALASQAIG